MNNALLGNNKTIRFYQEKLQEIYLEANRHRDFSDLYGYLDRTSGYLSKSMLEKKSSTTEFIRPISWLLSISNLLGIQIDDSFLRRYPGICPYCLTTNCVCIKTKKRPPNHIPAYQAELERELAYENFKANEKDLISFDRAVRLIKKIFYANEVIWRYAGPWHHVAKIHEEIAEVHESYCKFRGPEFPAPLSTVSSELCDVLAWILGAWGIVYPDKSLDDSFIDYYYNGCPVCKNEICNCPAYSNRPAGLINYREIQKIKENLKKMKNCSFISNAFQKKLDELIRSYDASIKNQNEPTTLLTIDQTNDWLTMQKEQHIADDELIRLINSTQLLIDNILVHNI